MQQLIGRLPREAQLCGWECGGNNYGGERCSPFTGWVRGPPPGKKFIWGSWMFYFSECLATREKNFSHEDDTFITQICFILYHNVCFHCFHWTQLLRNEWHKKGIRHFKTIGEFCWLSELPENLALLLKILWKYIYLQAVSLMGGHHASFSDTGCMSLLQW